MIQSSGEDCVWIDFITLPFLEDIAEVSETYDEIDAKVYPNPSTGFITVKANDLRHITIINAMGQVVYESNAAGNETQLDLSQFGSGLYLIRIATSKGMSTRLVQVGR